MIQHYDISHFRAPYKAATMQGFGADAAQTWYYDENPKGRVRCLYPAVAQILLATLAGTNPALKGATVYAVPTPAGAPGTEAVQLALVSDAAVAANPGMIPQGAQPAIQWILHKPGMVHAIWNAKGNPLLLDDAQLASGELAIVAGIDPQLLAGDPQKAPSAVFAGYTPVIKNVPVGPGGANKASMMGPGSYALLAAALGAGGYLIYKAMKKRR